MSGWVAGAIVVAAVVGAVAADRAGKKAAEGSEEAARIAAESADKGVAWQKEIYADYKPYLMEGLEGYQNLLEDRDAYKQSPGYLFRLQEGLKAIGIPDGGSNYLSGSQIKAATKYAEDYATSDYDRGLTRYAGLAGIASGATSSGAQVGSNVARTYLGGAELQGQYIQNAASARASGYMGASSALATGAQNYALYDAYKNPNPQTSAG